MKNNILKIILPILFFNFADVFAAQSSYLISENNAAKVRLIGSYYDDDQKNQQLIIAAQFKINSGWKIYGPDKSGFGQPPAFDLKNSVNIKNAANPNIHWPKAKNISEKIGNQTINYSVYEDEVVIPIAVEVFNKETATEIQADLMYGLCKEVCIPVSEKLNLKIMPQNEDYQVLSLVQYYWPEKIFLHDQDVLIKNLDLNFMDPPVSVISNFELLRILAIAFIGGLILNIMPCVLPVISIKLLSIISRAHARTSQIRKAYLATILGIIFSFLLLAVITASLKILGKSLGWGLQFQNPYFLIFLIIVLMVFTANLLGIFEVSFHSIWGAALNKTISEQEKQSNIFIPNFLSGILAVLLATPCSAPFLGTAISFALSENIGRIFLTFSVMGFGLAFPYVILIIFPGASKLLPKPGNWMVKVKQIMAGFLVATAIWLIYVLSENIGMALSMIIAVLAVLIVIFFKVDSKHNLKIPAKLLILTLICALMFAVPGQISHYFKIKEKQYDKMWIKFDEKQIPQLVSEGKTVIIDITADWCITCKVNKILILNSKEIIAKLKEPNIIAMRGDLTKMDDDLLNFMRLHNRYAIPFNIVYGPGAPNGILASELLNKRKFLEIIDNASSKPMK